MGFEQRDNSGALFQSTKKGSDKAPDYSGECMINGVAMQIAGWRKTSAKGTAYLSLAFQPKEAKEVSTPRRVKQGDDSEDLSDLPF